MDQFAIEIQHLRDQIDAQKAESERTQQQLFAQKTEAEDLQIQLATRKTEAESLQLQIAAQEKENESLQLQLQQADFEPIMTIEEISTLDLHKRMKAIERSNKWCSRGIKLHNKILEELHGSRQNVKETLYYIHQRRL